jgi:uncharacterized protein
MKKLIASIIIFTFTFQSMDINSVLAAINDRQFAVCQLRPVATMLNVKNMQLSIQPESASIADNTKPTGETAIYADEKAPAQAGQAILAKKINYKWLILLGFTAGMASATFGIGGGVIIGPALIFLYKMKDTKRATGTSLAAIVPMAAVGAIADLLVSMSNLKLSVAIFTFIGSLSGAFLGAKLSSRISNKALKVAFSILILFVGLRYANIVNIPVKSFASEIALPYYAYLFISFFGILGGAGSALFGIGGGVIFVPVLNLVFGLSIHQAITTSLFVIAPTTLFGGIFRKQYGHVDKDIAKGLVPASLPGAIAGTILKHYILSPAGLREFFGILLVAVSVNLLINATSLKAKIKSLIRRKPIYEKQEHGLNRSQASMRAQDLPVENKEPLSEKSGLAQSLEYDLLSGRGEEAIRPQCQGLSNEILPPARVISSLTPQYTPATEKATLVIRQAA